MNLCLGKMERIIIFFIIFRTKMEFLSPRSKKRWGYCNFLCPQRYLRLNHWTKSNQIWCESCSHEWGVQRHIYWHRPLGPWGGTIRSNIITFQLQSQFQIFLNQTICVFSQMKDIKHNSRDFHSVAWVMPRG